MARRWHFFFAWVLLINGLAYVLYSIGSRHLSRDLAPIARDWRSIGRSIKDHLRFRHPTGDAAKRYNVLQKLAYLIVIFVLLPLIILMGLGDVAVDELGAARAGSTSSAVASRRGRSTSSSPGCSSRSSRSTCSR